MPGKYPPSSSSYVLETSERYDRTESPDYDGVVVLLHRYDSRRKEVFR